MRETKFRAWDKDNKVMIYPDHIFPQEESIDCFGEVQLIPAWFIETKDRLFLQYTGLHDKNGKEIYEGDITCRHWDNGTWQNGVIIYDEASFLWKEIGGDEKHRLGFLHPIGINTKHSEVIGNIYENPELLKK